MREMAWNNAIADVFPVLTDGTVAFDTRDRIEGSFSPEKEGFGRALRKIKARYRGSMR